MPRMIVFFCSMPGRVPSTSALTAAAAAAAPVWPYIVPDAGLTIEVMCSSPFELTVFAEHPDSGQLFTGMLFLASGFPRGRARRLGSSAAEQGVLPTNPSAQTTAAPSATTTPYPASCILTHSTTP